MTVTSVLLCLLGISWFGVSVASNVFPTARYTPFSNESEVLLYDETTTADGVRICFRLEESNKELSIENLHNHRRIHRSALRFMKRTEVITGLPVAAAELSDDCLSSQTVLVNIYCRDCKFENAQKPWYPYLYMNETYTIRARRSSDKKNQGTVDIMGDQGGIIRALDSLIALIEHTGEHGAHTLAYDYQFEFDDDIMFEHPQNNLYKWIIPALELVDRPAYAWRGLLLDSARHFYPVEVVERVIDEMSHAKLNLLHWHLCDDQAFRFESLRFPRLHTVGGDNVFYSQKELKYLVEYAADRAIRIMPEIDIPGHASAMVVAYPSLCPWAANNVDITEHYDRYKIVETHAHCLDPTKNSTFEFLNELMQELSTVFVDEYYHLGGDEPNCPHWVAPSIQNFRQKTGLYSGLDLVAYCINRVSAFLQTLGKKTVVWDDVAHSGISKDIVVEVWHGTDHIAGVVNDGYRCINSAGFYIDNLDPAIDKFNVRPRNFANEQTAHLVVGGEVCLWSEWISHHNVESRLWPRVAAVAQRLWADNSQEKRDLYHALLIFLQRLEILGSQHRSYQQPMLLRLAGGSHSGAVVVGILAEAIIGRYGGGPGYTSMYPVGRISDVAAPESMVAFQFEEAVEEYVKCRSKCPEIYRVVKRFLTRWQKNHDRLKKLLPFGSTYLREILPVSEAVSKMAEHGLGALAAIEKKETFSQLNDARQIVNDWRDKVVAEVRIVIGPGITRILDAST